MWITLRFNALVKWSNRSAKPCYCNKTSNPLIRSLCITRFPAIEVRVKWIIVCAVPQKLEIFFSSSSSPPPPPPGGFPPPHWTAHFKSYFQTKWCGTEPAAGGQPRDGFTLHSTKSTWFWLLIFLIRSLSKLHDRGRKHAAHTDHNNEWRCCFCFWFCQTRHQLNALPIAHNNKKKKSISFHIFPRKDHFDCRFYCFFILFLVWSVSGSNNGV